MTAATYTSSIRDAAPAPTAAKPAIAGQSVWSRLWNAFVEARMRQAMREIALHRHLLPGELEASFNRGSAKINP